MEQNQRGGAGILLRLACLYFILECFLKLGCAHWFTLMFANCSQQHQQLPCYHTCCYHNETFQLIPARLQSRCFGNGSTLSQLCSGSLDTSFRLLPTLENWRYFTL